VPTNTVEDGGAARPLRTGWRGLALILAFWTLFGGMMAASLFLSGLSRRGEATPLAVVAFALLGAYAWAALTVPLFLLAQRLNLTGDQGTWRVFRVGGLLAAGLVFSGMVSIALGFASWLVLGGMVDGRLASSQGPWLMARYRLMYDILACYLILTAGVARDYFLRYRSRLAEATLLRTQLAEARLQVLRAQLNPHFLFNTLNAVAALVQTDPRGVRRMIALLSDMLRETLDGASEPEVPLERELDLLRRYLEIMEIRFRGRVDTSVDVDSEVERALVPHLVLQPLVENAMKHGIGRSSDPGLVEIAASRRGDQLVLTVRDSGCGRSVGDDERTDLGYGAGGPDGHGGFGLRHTRERLHQLYGDEATLELRAAEGGGTVAEVRLPCHFGLMPLQRAPGSVVSANATPTPAAPLPEVPVS
jgi:two-component system, LytTR family, sensor kinase